jgi:A/G-specific adenine glycosylase
LHITPLRIQLSRKPTLAAHPGNVWLKVEDALRAAIPTPVRKILAVGWVERSDTHHHQTK